MRTHFDCCVLGAGLAGMHTALELLDQGVSVCIIDPNGIAGGASGTPVGLANPATGRFASRSWKAEESLNHLSQSLHLAQDVTDKSFFKQSGVLRPAMDEKIALRMQKNLESDAWEPNSITWLNEEEVKHFHPGISCTLGGVWIPNGFTVHIPEYLNALKLLIEQKGGVFILNINYELTHKVEWAISCSDASVVIATHIIFTSGISTKNSDYWNHLKLHPVKGQTLVVKTRNPITFDHAVSALGYFSKIKDQTLIVGSTYEHKFEHKDPDDAGEEYMLKRLKKVLPELADGAEVVSRWAGIRASSPDRKPYIGAHPNIERCYVFAGLGSKGLLYSAIGAHLLSNHIIQNAELPIDLHLNRFA